MALLKRPAAMCGALAVRPCRMQGPKAAALGLRFRCFSAPRNDSVGVSSTPPLEFEQWDRGCTAETTPAPIPLPPQAPAHPELTSRGHVSRLS